MRLQKLLYGLDVIHDYPALFYTHDKERYFAIICTRLSGLIPKFQCWFAFEFSFFDFNHATSLKIPILLIAFLRFSPGLCHILIF